MHIILVPGLWLDGSTWERVIPSLEEEGHRAHPLTLPGMESKDADRSGITLGDHVAAVVAAIDAVDSSDGPVLLVGHSAGCGVAYAALDARPDRVARAVLIGGFPTADGEAVAAGFATDNGDIPLPDWSEFDAADLGGLDEGALAEFSGRAIPSPAHLTGDPQQLSNERRYDVPVTAICTEYSSATLRAWIRDGAAPVQEFTKIRDVDYVDVPTSHWPQFSRPKDLARAIVASITPAENVDDVGRPGPPIAGDETAMVLGFLELHRATLAWKCSGLDADWLRATTASSTMTLGGLLKHLAWVEDLWFSRRLRGNDPAPPWDTVDWKSDSDWEWHSAADDTPEELFALWEGAVARSRELVAAALADGGLDRPAVWVDGWFGRAPSLRWIVLHMIEEYARHNGHADLLRESVDGQTGE